MGVKEIWTEEQLELLQKMWGKFKLVNICKTLDKSRSSITKKAIKLGIYEERLQTKKRWTKQEKLYLEQNYYKLSLDQLMIELDATRESIKKQAQFLEITNENKHWTKEEEEYLSEKWGIVTVKHIAKRLDRTVDSILLKAHKLGLRNQIIANGEYLTPQNVSELLGKSVSSIYHYIRKNHLEYRKFKTNKNENEKYQISVKQFKKFLENHTDKWNTLDCDLNLIQTYFNSIYITSKGKVVVTNLPLWFQEKIKNDKEKNIGIIKNKSKGNKPLKQKNWTINEEKTLLYLKSKNFNFKEICERLNRSYNSVTDKYYKLQNKKTTM